uniref:Uncharacterized protein n=1 Tax=Strongyloides papillosus TaxID=174720 RepID=A0A0N5BTU2_STREA
MIGINVTNNATKASYFDGFCHDTLDNCHQKCGDFQCIPVNRCNGVDGQFFVCSFFDPKLLMYIMLTSFMVVLLCCSSIVACYVCRYAKRSFDQAHYVDGHVVLNGVSSINTLPHQNYTSVKVPPREEKIY